MEMADVPKERPIRDVIREEITASLKKELSRANSTSPPAKRRGDGLTPDREAKRR